MLPKNIRKKIYIYVKNKETIVYLYMWAVTCRKRHRASRGKRVVRRVA